MADLRPNQLILRCYGHKTEKRNWIGLCVDLNIAVEAESPDILRQKMKEAIQSYLETVLDTGDRDSIPGLLFRRAPLHDWLLYYYFKFKVFIKQFPDNFTFKEWIPFHLSHSC